MASPKPVPPFLRVMALSAVRWIDLEKLRRIGKELRRGHRIDLNLWRRFHIDAWINL
jgi:hypothetical protein